MRFLAFVAVTLLWPIATLGSMFVLQLLLIPVYSAIWRTSKNGQYGLLMADVFQAVVLAATQIVVVVAGKFVFSLFGQEPTRWLAAPFFAWCVLYPLFGHDPSRLGSHIWLSWSMGLCGGWLIAIIWLF